MRAIKEMLALNVCVLQEAEFALESLMAPPGSGSREMSIQS